MMTRFKADLILLFVSFIWGVTFLLIKNEFTSIGPMSLIFWRFLIATLILFVFLRKNLFNADRKTIVTGCLIGVFLGIGYLFQTYGMQFTTSGKAGFLTAAYVALVPLMTAVFFRQIPSRGSLIGVVIVSVGMAMLCLERDFSFNSGDLWVLGCAFWFGLQVVFLGHFTQGKWKMDPGVLTLTQVASACFVAFIGNLMFEEFRVDYPARTWGVILFLAVIATALLLFLQTYAQKYTTSTHAALMFMGEPVFAALIGWHFADEVLSLQQLLGCGVILSGMVLAEVGIPAFFFLRAKKSNA